MTSEICLMNRMSVVLAADSASTISYYENGQLEKRYFKGANKVFQLSDSHPVGLMIYGNAEVMGVPWELVIKAFRKHLGNSSFDSVEGYATAFQQFLNDSKQFFPLEERGTDFCNAAELQTVLCCKQFNEAKEAQTAFDEGAQLDTLMEQVDAVPFENGLDDDFLKVLLEKWPAIILERLRSEPFPAYQEHLRNRTDTQLLRIIELSIMLKAKQPPESSTGLVFAGFGDASVYPETFVSQSTGFIAEKLVMTKLQNTKISKHTNSYISGFAQSSMADTFIIGFDEQAYYTIRMAQEASLPDMIAPFVASLGGVAERTQNGAVLKDADGNVLIDEQQFNQLAGDVLQPVGEVILEDSRRKHGEPLERVISMLPVEEMAELAATMVDLQSLKEKVTRPSETVGGPVDVAIITKNEGLVWKKRKHFFDIDLNQRYLRRLHTKD